MTFAERLRELRTRSDMTQVKLANKIGIHVYTLRAYESGQRMPSVEPLCWIADYFGVTTDYLLGRTDKK